MFGGGVELPPGPGMSGAPRAVRRPSSIYSTYGRTILEGMFRENLLGLPLWRYDHPGIWSVVGRRN